MSQVQERTWKFALVNIISYFKDCGPLKYYESCWTIHGRQWPMPETFDLYPNFCHSAKLIAVCSDTKEIGWIECNFNEHATFPLKLVVAENENILCWEIAAIFWFHRQFCTLYLGVYDQLQLRNHKSSKSFKNCLWLKTFQTHVSI